MNSRNRLTRPNSGYKKPKRNCAVYFRSLAPTPVLQPPRTPFRAAGQPHPHSFLQYKSVSQVVESKHNTASGFLQQDSGHPKQTPDPVSGFLQQDFSQHSAQGLPQSGLISIATCRMEEPHPGLLLLLVLEVLFICPWHTQSRELHAPLQPSGIAAADVGPHQAGSGSLRQLLQSPSCPDGCLPDACWQSSTRGGLRCGQCAKNLVVDHVSGLCGEEAGVSVSSVPGAPFVPCSDVLCTHNASHDGSCDPFNTIHSPDTTHWLSLFVYCSLSCRAICRWRSLSRLQQRVLVSWGHIPLRPHACACQGGMSRQHDDNRAAAHIHLQLW